MRVLMSCLAALAVVPAQADTPTDQQKLLHFNYQLAVAEAPGDVRSDQRMAQMLTWMIAYDASTDASAPASEAMNAFLARAQVVTAELEMNVAAVRDADPFLLGGDLGCGRKQIDPATCSARRATLETLVGDNAYHALVLMTYAWTAEDAEGFVRAARLAASAPDYESDPALAFQSLRDRYRKVPPPDMPGMGELARLHAPEVMAMSVAMATALPPLQGFSQPCRESEGELRDHCLALAIKMMERGQNVVEIYVAKSVVEALGSPAQIEIAVGTQRRLEWLRARSVPLLAASEHGRVAGMDAFFDAQASHGEIAAMQALLRAHDIDIVPPEAWSPSIATDAQRP